MNGLDDLTAQREAAKRPQRAKRTMPPVRHPRPALTPTSSEASAAAPAVAATTSAEEGRPPEGVVGADPAETRSAAKTDAPDMAPAAVRAPEGPGAKRVAARTPRAKAPVVPPAESKAAESVEAAGTKVRPVTVSLDETDIDWLDGLRILGMQSKPKVDIGRSALVRLALARLRDQMTDDEVWAHLAQKAAQAQGTGVSGRRRL